MNDFDDIISGAVAARADGAPIDAPDFQSVLAARQDRLRRRTALAAGGLVVAGLAGIGLFATAGDEAPGVAGAPSSTSPAGEDTGTVPSEGGIWFCVGRLDDPYRAGTGSVTETTIIVDTSPPIAGTEPPEPTTTTTMSTPDDAPPPDEDVTVTTFWPTDDSGYYAHCTLVADGIDGAFGPDGLPLMTTTTISPEPPEDTVPVTTISEEEARAAAEAEARQEAEEARRRAETATTETVPTTSVETTDGG